MLLLVGYSSWHKLEEMYVCIYRQAAADGMWENSERLPIITSPLLLNWCFEPSQPLWIISGLKETFIKKYTVEGAL